MRYFIPRYEQVAYMIINFLIVSAMAVATWLDPTQATILITGHILRWGCKWHLCQNQDRESAEEFITLIMHIFH